MVNWVKACKKEDIELEDLIRFDYENKTYAIYCSPDENYFCTDGLCTHENVHLEDGLVMDDLIECPMHNGQFNYKTCKAIRSPVWRRQINKTSAPRLCRARANVRHRITWPLPIDMDASQRITMRFTTPDEVDRKPLLTQSPPVLHAIERDAPRPQKSVHEATGAFHRHMPQELRVFVATDQKYPQTSLV